MGSRFLVSLNPGFNNSLYYFQDLIANTDAKRIENVSKLGISLEYIYRKPISIKWQSNFSANTNYIRNWSFREYYKIDENPSTYNSKSNYGSTAISYGIGYYPNTRSNITAYVSSSLSIRSIEKGLSPSSDLYNSFGLSGYYYISERLRANANFQLISRIDNFLLHSESNQWITDTFSQFFNMSFTYQIF